MTKPSRETAKPVLTDDQLHSYQEAVDKGRRWLLGRLQADGTFDARSHNLRCYLKSPLALLMAGAPRAAYRVLDAAKRRYLCSDGDFRTSAEAKYATDRFNQGGERNFYLYGNGWATISAQINGRYDISYPALAYLLQCQDPRSGGFFSRRGGAAETEQRQDVASTASCSNALLLCGKKSEAERAGDFLIRLFELQPQADRFCLNVTPEGVVDRFSQDDAFSHVVDQRKEKQAYWILGYASAVLARIHLATTEPLGSRRGVHPPLESQKHLDGAGRYFDFLTACCPDSTSFFGCWKVGWAAALLSSILGREEYARTAAGVLDHIVSAQDEQGYWFWGGELGMGPENDDWLFDLSSEMIVWLSEIPRILLSRGIE